MKRSIFIALLFLSASLSAIPLAQVKSTLWPRATYNPSLMVAGAQSKALSAYGRGEDGSILDVGALREINGQAEVLTPGGWTLYIEREHKGAANAHSRVGPGWSFGNNSIHNSGRGWFFTICGRKPDQLESFDMQYSGQIFETLKRGAAQGVSETEREAICGKASAVTPPVVITPPPPVISPPVVTPPVVVIPPTPVVCPPVICPACPTCPSQSVVICPVLSRLSKEFSCQGF